MPLEYRGQGRLRGMPVEGRGSLHEHRLVEGGDLAAPLRGAGEDRGAADVTDGDVVGVHGGRGPAVLDPGEGLGGAELEDLPRADRKTFPPSVVDQLDRDDAVAAQREEVVGDAHRFHPEDTRHQRTQGFLGSGTGRDVLAGRAEIRLGQRTPIQFSVGGEREPIEDDERRRHHVLRQLRRRPHPQLGDVRHRILLRHHVGREILCTRKCLPHDDGTVPDGGMRHDARLDVLEFESHAPDLHLIVGAAEEVEGTVRRPPGEVTGSVQPGAVVRERVGDEAGRRQPRGVHVSAAEEESAGVQLTARAERHRVQVFVQHVQLRVGVRATDRRRDPRGVLPVDHVRHTDRRLRRAVAVIQRDGELRSEPLEQTRREDLAAAPHVLQRRQPIRAPRQVEQHVQHRRHEVDERHRLARDQVQQILRVPLPAGLGHHQPATRDQRQQNLVHGDVERQRGLEQRRVRGPEAQDLVTLPQQPRADGLVTDHGALGPARRTRREDDIRQPRTLHGHRGPLGGLLGIRPRREVDRHGPLPRVGDSAGTGENERGPGVGEDRHPAVLRPRRVEGHERPTRAHDGEQSDHHLRGTRETDRHNCFRLHPAGAQVMGQLRHAFPEFPVGEPGVAGDQGLDIRCPRHLSVEQLGNRHRFLRGRGVVELHQQLRALGLRHRIERRDGLRRVGDELPDEVLEPAAMLLELGAETGRRPEIDLDGLRILPTADGEIEVADRSGGRTPHPRRETAERQRVLEHHGIDSGTEDLTVRIERSQVAGEVLAAVAAVPQHRDQRRVDAGGELTHGHLGIHLHPERQDRRAHSGDAAQFASDPGRHRQRQREVAAAGEPVDVRHDRGERQPGAPDPGVGGEGVDRVGVVAVDLDEGGDRRPGVVDDLREQPRRLRRVDHLLDPEVAVGLEARRRTVVAVGRHDRVEGPRRRRRLEFRVLVSIDDIGHQQGDAVSVDDAVVVALVPDHRLVAGTQQGVPEQRFVALDVDDDLHVAVHPRACTRFGILVAAQVHDGEGPLARGRRHLQQFVVGASLETHMQGFGSFDGLPNRRGGTVQVDPARDLDDEREVVDRAARIQLLSDPHLGLRGRHRQRDRRRTDASRGRNALSRRALWASSRRVVRRHGVIRSSVESARPTTGTRRSLG
ncbi:hypothetical protein RW1_093_00700 [Rhodococcus wratislaviensis NBRC 100605]|uniref:Uncharacterized protein n=1 Tax=Rhodococcus wratislaviensis NBRC 100605 TaxID=1219028 RepID=X0REV5_RHOWR|nr:hypothetical protein RW1_093_00700 [Rhodococcus wratislaviensis NBRC 100605]